MCNIPCSMCGDYEDCTIREGTLFKFRVYENNEYKMDFVGSITEAENFSFYNPEYTLILIQAEDPDLDNLGIL